MTSKSDQAEQRTSPAEDPIIAASRARRAEQAEANLEPVRAAQARLAPLLAEGQAALVIGERWQAAHGATLRTRRAELAAVPQDGSVLARRAWSMFQAIGVFEAHLHNIANVERAVAIIAALQPRDFPTNADAGFLGNRSGAAKQALTNAVASGTVLDDAWVWLDELWHTKYAAATGAPVTPRALPLPDLPERRGHGQTHARGSLSAEA